MSAIRVARAATAKDKIIKFGGCYHGHSDSMLVKAGSGLAEMAVSDSAGVGATTASNTIVAPLNDIEAFRKIISLHGAQTAAVILEPVPANNGLLLQTNDFLKQIVGIARGAGVLIIFDEVITGFRVGFGGMAGVTGLEPDLVTYGKIIGGGFPVGAFGGRQELMDLVAPLGPVYQAGTLSANPVAVAAGLTTLRKLKRENPYQKLADATSTLAEALEKAAQRAGDIPLHVQNVASLFWPVWGELKTSDNVVRTIEQIPSKHSETFRKLYPHLLKEGIYLAPSAFEVGFWSMAHTSDDQEKLTEGLSTAIKNSGAAVGS
jgi:glutamate-1-semialdehyde 2,1-aminomutase